MSKLLETVEVQTKDDVQYSIIWLHGLGADANDFLPIVPELKLPANIGVRFVFPNAPIRPITINNGMAMRGWYDILDLTSLDQRADEQGLRESQQQIEALIKQENNRGIPTNHIILAGFSQGCAMTLQTGLRYPEKLAGLICLSGYLPLHTTIEAELSEANRQTPIFMAHGSFDPVVPLQAASLSHDVLTNLNYSITRKNYPMGHQVCAPEINDLSLFLQHILR
ncbi:alpha/beta hydrolase [Pelistega sp. MC2]|uniref:alpha/beta hydrolase n=1 Tax=Pelistega sp. MC2 TaxID=1720297 RepID=UPI0008DB2640|nr:carboxylesterase [Pelistega sp. MC2]